MTPAAPSSASLMHSLLPFLRPYRWRVVIALSFLLLAAAATLVFPMALRALIDDSLVPAGHGERLLSMQGHFLDLFAVAIAMGIFSAARFYMVSWLGERISADIRNAVYAHVLHQSPVFFETTQTGEVLSRLSADTTLVQTVVGSSLSMGLRNLVMGCGALVMLIWTNPMVMAQVLGILLLVVAPAAGIGRRVRRLSRASQDRAADSSAIAAEILNAITLVQSYTAEEREVRRFGQATQSAFETAVRRSRARSALIAFIIIASAAALLWGLYQGTQAVISGHISAGHMGQTVVYVIILASAFAVLGEVYGDLQRAAGASERLMELLASQSDIRSPASPLTLPPADAGSTLCFDKVSFRYPSRPMQAALSDFSLSVKAGQTVALVGPSGAGKSTEIGRAHV